MNSFSQLADHIPRASNEYDTNSLLANELMLVKITDLMQYIAVDN